MTDNTGTVKDGIVETVKTIVYALLIAGVFRTLFFQPFWIPSGSMKDTLLIGDFLFVNKMAYGYSHYSCPFGLCPFSGRIMGSMPKRGDVVVFIKPVPDMVNDKLQYLYLVKRLIGVPGDRIHLQDGVVYINGVAQPWDHAQPTTSQNFVEYLDDFPAVPMSPDLGATEAWSVSMMNHVKDGNLVVPPGMYFMMGDNRHDSLDSRFWGFVPRADIIGRPLFNYWSFRTPEDEYNQTGLGPRLAWMGHILLHFFTGTRWERTFHVIR